MPAQTKPPADKIPVALQLEEAMRLGLIKILSNVKVNERGCWVWQGGCNPTWGYGHTSWRGATYAVHRLLWELMKGPIPVGKILCHTCDNPPCCNPDHLWIGTDQENHVDKTTKGRHHYDPSVKTHCKQGHEFTLENTRMTPVEGRPGLYRRQCKTCTKLGHQKPEYIEWRRNYQRKRRAEKRAARLAAQSAEAQA
jgi:hypothetical protein